MVEIYVGKTKNYTVPAGANKLSIVHELGDLIVSQSSVSGSYSFIADSIGVHKFLWLNNTTLIQTDFYDAVNQYVTDSDFFLNNDNLSNHEADFQKIERKIRRIINNFTQQKFGPLINKTITIEGTGTNALFLNYPINKLVSVIDSFGNDISALIQIDPSNNWFLDRQSVNYGYTEARLNGTLYDVDVKTDLTRDLRRTFRESINYVVTGDFGWYWVPQDVTEAAQLLIADNMSGDADLRSHRIKEAQLGDFQYMLGDIDGSTGNTEADILLSPYVMLNIGLA